MKLTTLNKLEKQLRESRGREVPDLTPPPGGWEAINAELATDPVGGQAPVDQPTTPSWIKWGGGGMGVFLLIIAAVFMPPSVNVTEEQKAVAAVQQPLAVASVAADEGTARMSESEAGQQESGKDIRNSEVTGSHVSGESDEVIEPADKATPTEQKDEIVVGKKGVAEQDKGRSESNRSTSKATGNSGVPTKKAIPETAPSVSDNKDDGLESIDIDTSQLRMADPEPKAEIFADKNRDVYLPIELPSLLSGLELPTDEWPTVFTPVAPIKRGIFRRWRIKTRPEWQLHGSISGFVGEDLDGTLAYNVDPAGNPGLSFVRPSGGLIHVEPVAVSGHSNRLEQIYLKAGINRQTSSGFLFRSSIGLIRSKSFQIGPDGELMADVVEVKTAKNETIVPIEFGVQYTFLRRRRIKPYAGVHLVGYLNYLGVDESYFTEGATGEEGLVSRFSSQEFISLGPDLAVTLGLQYQVTRRVSAGVFLWGNMGGNFYAQAPFGMEVRYSLK